LAFPERFDLVGTQLSVASSGISINPDPQAQQITLQKAYQVDVKEREDREKISAQFRIEQFSDEVKDDEENKDEVDDVGPQPARVVVEKRLTQAQQNKKKRKKLIKEEDKKRKIAKALKEQLKILPNVIQSINEEEKQNQQDKEQLEELKKNPNKPLRLGKNLYQPDFPDVVLTEDIQGGHFRNIRPSLKVIKDQFKRFEEKNIIEPRTKARYKRRYKMKFKRSINKDAEE